MKLALLALVVGVLCWGTADWRLRKGNPPKEEIRVIRVMYTVGTAFITVILLKLVEGVLW